MDGCGELYGVIVVLDEAWAQRELRASRLRCPGCSGRLRAWGFARARWLWQSGGARLLLRPRRARCCSCAVTQVLLPAVAPPRHAYTVDVVGQVLLGAAEGRSHRTIAARLGVPADTVRGWIRRADARAEWLRVEATTAAALFDPVLAPIEPTVCGSALAEAVEALGRAAAAARLRLAPTATAWQLIAVIARGRLLAPLRSD